MDFFAREEQTRRTSRVLVGAFLLAFVVCALATTLALAIAFRWANPNALYVGTAGWPQWVAANLGFVASAMGVTLAIMGAASEADLYRLAAPMIASVTPMAEATKPRFAATHCGQPAVPT